VRLWETEGAGLADAAVSRRSAGAHSGVRLAVVPLSGEVESGCEPPSLDIYAKRSKNVRLQNNLSDGVNRAALLRRPPENFRGKGRRADMPGHSPLFSAAADTTFAEPQVFGYVEETTRRSGGQTKGDDVNRWGRQFRVKMIWLPKSNKGYLTVRRHWQKY
jgi:hypothetical protein